MASASLTKSGDTRARVEDYIDDQIQTAADFDNVAGLLSRVHDQQELLKKQLEDARRALSDAQTSADERTTSLEQRAWEFQRQQAELDHRLNAITQSTVSDDAVKTFESRMNTLRRLEVAHGYIGLAQQVNKLSAQARDTLQAQPGASLEPYLKLRQLRQRLQDAQPAAEGAAPHLVDLVERETDRVYHEMKNALENDLRRTLERMKWPQKELNLQDGVLDAWDTQVGLLLDLQEPDLLDQIPSDGAVPASPTIEPIILLPVEVMVQPLAARFRYHFYGERPTNRLDKPEYFLTHILDLLDRHHGFMTEVLGPIIDGRLRRFEALENVYTDAVSSFINGLLPMVVVKCLSVLPQISSQPQLLSHFIHELMAFDGTLRDSWAYTPVPRLFTEWRGVTWSMLTTHGYFQPWLEVEKDFALARYKTIRDAPDSGDIDFDAETGQTKPTKGAIRVNDLLETITDRYRTLSSFSHKMKFLIDIQLSIFDDYHNYLHGALQAFLVSSHTAGRLLQGESVADALGIKGLESLTKIFSSAEFLERKMSDWSDDLFFLELWDELQDRARANSGANASVGQDLQVDDVAAKTSSAIKSLGNDSDFENDGGALFDETALSYRRLRERCEGEILRTLDFNTRNALRPFIKVSHWSSLSVPTDDGALAASPALDGILQTLSSLLGYLARVLALGPLRRITKHVASTIHRELYDNVLMYHNFSSAGAAQLKRDVAAIEEGIESVTKVYGPASGSMNRLNEALSLLGLPTRQSSVAASADDGDGWGFEEPDEAATQDDDGGAGAPASRISEKELGLWEAEKLIFQTNESARKALADLGLYHLSEADARNILKRRIELNS